MTIVRQLVILYFLDYRIAGVVPCTENIPEDEVTKHSHAWIYNDHFNESETGQIGNLGWSLDPYIKCKCMHILRILANMAGSAAQFSHPSGLGGELFKVTNI